jgi:predicted Fe-S protein YdhL (DUF1289 family)
MPTPFSKIDDMFLSDISDDTLLDYTEEERENILDSLRIKAITRFKACKQDLSDRDEVNRVFNQDLSDEVCLIISTIMRKFWLNDKIYNLELLRQRMSTKDWKLTSQANHLQILTELKQELDKEISRMIIEYTVYAYKANE